MPDHWLSMDALPDAGREFTFAGPNLLAADWQDYGLDFREAEPLAATVHVQRSGHGLYVKGRLAGSVTSACDRCTAEVPLPVDAAFEFFEEPPAPGENLDESLVREADGHLQLNVGRLLWEQFNLGLPVKILCQPTCKGLCPGCGRDLNVEACDCSKDEGDPRLAALRGLQIKKGH